MKRRELRWHETIGATLFGMIIVIAGGAIWADETASAKDLGEILLERGVISKEDLQQAREQEQQEHAAQESRLDAFRAKLPKWLDVFTPFGDIRLRHEGFYQDELNARNRFRFRARVGMVATVSDEVSGTVRLATGSSNDPISTNQTADNTFTRKSINLDWAYVTLKPGKTLGLAPGWVTVTAGKFGVSAYRLTEMVWDDDVSPEGATETLHLVDSSAGFLRGVRVSAFQWVIDEIAAAGDPWIPGGQLVADMAPYDGALWTVGFADYYYDRTDAVARKFLNQYNDPPANTKANSSYNGQLANSNAVVKDANGKIIGYRSGFNVINVGTELSAVDPVGVGIPAGLFADFAYNTEADGRNVGLSVGAGIGKAGRDWYRNPLKKQGDWGMSYTYAWVEQDAVLSMFSFSDYNEFSTRAATAGAARPTQKGGTNVMSHIVRVDYVLLPSVQLTAKAYIENVLDRWHSNAALTGNPTLVRTQLDAMLRF